MSSLERRLSTAMEAARQVVRRYGFTLSDRALLGVIRRVALYLSSRNFEYGSLGHASQRPSLRADLLESLREDPVQLAAALTALKKTHFFGSNSYTGWRRPDMETFVRKIFPVNPNHPKPRAIEFHGLSVLYLEKDHVNELKSLSRLIRARQVSVPPSRTKELNRVQAIRQVVREVMDSLKNQKPGRWPWRRRPVNLEDLLKRLQSDEDAPSDFSTYVRTLHGGKAPARSKETLGDLLAALHAHKMLDYRSKAPKRGSKNPILFSNGASLSVNRFHQMRLAAFLKATEPTNK